MNEANMPPLPRETAEEMVRMGNDIVTDPELPYAAMIGRLRGAGITSQEDSIKAVLAVEYVTHFTTNEAYHELRLRVQTTAITATCLLITVLVAIFVPNPVVQVTIYVANVIFFYVMLSKVHKGCFMTRPKRGVPSC